MVIALLVSSCCAQGKAWSAATVLEQIKAQRLQQGELRVAVYSEARLAGDPGPYSATVASLGWCSLKPCDWSLQMRVGHVPVNVDWRDSSRGPELDTERTSVIVGGAWMWVFWDHKRLYSRVRLATKLPARVSGLAYSVMWGFSPKIQGLEPEVFLGAPVDLISLLECPGIVIEAEGDSLSIYTGDRTHCSILVWLNDQLYVARRMWKAADGRLLCEAASGPVEVAGNLPHCSAEWEVTNYVSSGDQQRAVVRKCKIVELNAGLELWNSSEAARLRPGMAEYDSHTESVLQVVADGHELIDSAAEEAVVMARHFGSQAAESSYLLAVLSIICGGAAGFFWTKRRWLRKRGE